VSAIARTIDGYLAETVGAVGARRLIPTHWDDFTQPLDERLTPMPLAVRLDRFFDDVARLRLTSGVGAPRIAEISSRNRVVPRGFEPLLPT
jgi:hypothetical protein